MPACGARVKKLSWHTTFGDVSIDEPQYRKGRKRIRPFAQSAQVRNRGCSLPLQRVITDFGADQSFAQAMDKIVEHYGVVLSESTIARTTEWHAGAIFEAAPEPQGWPDRPGSGTAIIVETDGGMVPIVEIDPTQSDISLNRTPLLQVDVESDKVEVELASACKTRYQLIVTKADEIQSRGSAMDPYKTRVFVNFLIFLKICILFCGNAYPHSAVIEGDLAKIGNDILSITLDRNTGTIRAITDKTTGQNLVTDQVGIYKAMWAINLAQDAGQQPPFADNNSSGTPIITVLNAASEASILLEWYGLNFTTGEKSPQAKISARISVADGDPLSRWRFSATGVGNRNVTRVYFPLLSGVQRLGNPGEDNFLLLPEQSGRIIKDPIGSRYNWYRIYPSSAMAMQMIAYYSQRSGFYLATYDTRGQSKTINWYSPPESPSTAIVQATHLFPDEPTDQISLPYEAVLGVFHGDWTRAADLYKSWASQQAWFSNSATRSLPSWLKDNHYGTHYCVHCFPDSKQVYADLTAEQSSHYSLLGGSSLIFLDGWEKMGSWYYGDNLPPAEGWERFNAMVDAVHGSGNRFHQKIGAAKLDGATPLWKSGAASTGVMRRKNGEMIGTRFNVYGAEHMWYMMNPGSEFWRNNQINTVAEYARHGIDAIQFDGYPIGEPEDDYSEGHPPGVGGTWQWEAWQSLLSQALAAARSARADTVFSSEEGHELLLPYMAFFEQRDLGTEINEYSQLAAPVPLFGYVYKPWTYTITDYWPFLGKDQPASYHALAFARALVWGQRQPVLYGPALSAPSLMHARTFQRYLASGRAQSRYSRFLLNGTMLPPPAVVSLRVNVELLGDGYAIPSYKGNTDAVQAGAWRSPAGETGIVMTNIADKAVEMKISVDFERLGLTPGTRYAVALESERGNRSLGEISASGEISATLQADEIAMLLIRKPRPATAAINSLLLD